MHLSVCQNLLEWVAGKCIAPDLWCHTSSDPHHFFSPPSNPYFVQTPWFFYPKSFYFFVKTKSILRQTPIILFLRRQIHTLFAPHDFSASNPFISLLIPNPYFVSPLSFFCLNSFYFFILAKSILCSNPMIFLHQMLLFLNWIQFYTS